MADDSQSNVSSYGSNVFADIRPSALELAELEEPEVNPDQLTAPRPTMKPSTRGGKQPARGGQQPARVRKQPLPSRGGKQYARSRGGKKGA